VKLTYLILAHKNPAQLARLIKALASGGGEFFIHLDKRCNPRPFLDSLTFPQQITAVHFIRNNVALFSPPHYALVRAILNSLSEILSLSTGFDYLILLSGQDYPLKTNEQIKAHFTRNRGGEFLEGFPLPADPARTKDEFNFRMGRVQRYHFDDLFRGKYIKGTNRLARWILPPKKFPSGYTPYWGSTWWRITYGCATFILDFAKNNDSFIRFFRFANCPDEFVFHTIVLNSPFSANVVDDNLTFIDWSAGGFHPKVLTSEDFKNLATAEKLFARKFDIDTDSRVLDLIDAQRAAVPTGTRE
jgi:hypothetical protein